MKRIRKTQATLDLPTLKLEGGLFLPDQLVEYEKARSRIPQVKQAELFVSDERSAIDWLTNFLLKRPSTRSEIHPEYIPQIGSAKRKGEIIRAHEEELCARAAEMGEVKIFADEKPKKDE